MKVVIDTNVLIAGLYSKKGASFLILEAALQHRLDYAVSPLIALEYLGKIEDKIREGFLELPLPDYLAILSVLVQNGRQVLRPVLQRPTLPDYSDDKLLECAISDNCQIILTFNRKDFPMTILQEYGIKAMTPGEFLHQGELRL